MKNVTKLCITTIMIAITVACASSSDCETSALTCDGDMLQECVDGAWVDLEDCSLSGQMCHEEMGHCMDMGT